MGKKREKVSNIHLLNQKAQTTHRKERVVIGNLPLMPTYSVTLKTLETSQKHRDLHACTS